MTGLGSSTLQNCGQGELAQNNLLEKLGMVSQLLNRDTGPFFTSHIGKNSKVEKIPYGLQGNQPFLHC